MQRTAIAFLVSAFVASPVALAQTSGQNTAAQQSQAANAAAEHPSAAASGETNKGIPATEVPVMSDEQRAQARSRLGVGTTMEGIPDRAQANMRQLTVDDLEDMDIYNGEGEEIGSVEEIVAGADQQQYVVIAEGGFLGIGEDHVVLPLDRFWVQGDDRLVVYGVTEEDLERLGDYRDARADYSDLGDTDTADVPEWTPPQ